MAKKGSLQLWVHNMSTEGDISLSDDAQFFSKLIRKFDISTILGRYSCNYGFIGNGRDRQVVLFDNAETFSLNEETGTSSLQPTESVLKKARQLNMDQLKHIQHINEAQKEVLLRRRDALMRGYQQR